MEEGSRYYRKTEMDGAVALLHAGARLADALARLRGRTQLIRVEREGVSPAPKGSIGRDNG